MISSRMRRLAAAVLAAGAAVAVMLVVPAPAKAVPGLVTVTVESADDSSTTKTLIATCPAGTAVIGGGGTVRFAESQVLLTGLRPLWTPFGTGYQATATEDDTGFSGSWQLQAYAICAPKLAGLQFRWMTSNSHSDSSRMMWMSCLDGRKVIGVGAVINGGGQHVGLRRVQPMPDLSGVMAEAHEDETGYGGSWSLTAWAVCADPLPGLQRVHDSSYSGSSGFVANSALAECPWPKRVHGFGGLVAGSPGQVFLRSLRPEQEDAVRVLAAEDQTGHDGTWRVWSFAICAF